MMVDTKKICVLCDREITDKHGWYLNNKSHPVCQSCMVGEPINHATQPGPMDVFLEYRPIYLKHFIYSKCDKCSFRSHMWESQNLRACPNKCDGKIISYANSTDLGNIRNIDLRHWTT